MKIAFLNIYQNKVTRGAEVFINELSKRLAKNHEVDVISEVNYLNLLKKDYDLIIPTNGRLQVLIVRIITWLKGIKMIVTGHSGPGFDDRINLLVFPDVFVALSDFQFKWASRINPFVRIVKISNGVDLTRFKIQDSRFRNNKVILSVGAFTKDKRHDLTIRAVTKLSGVKLLIVGEGGSERSRIYDLGSKMLGEGRFQILSVSNGKMPEIYKKASAFTYPTVPWESFGIAMLEAMASGLPVVATDDPIRREIVGDAGLFVDPNDTNAYSQMLEKALNTDWGNKPRKQAEKFDWDKIAKQYEQLFTVLVR